MYNCTRTGTKLVNNDISLGHSLLSYLRLRIDRFLAPGFDDADFLESLVNHIALVVSWDVDLHKMRGSNVCFPHMSLIINVVARKVRS